MGILTKEQILVATDTSIETIEVPEWGGSVQMRTLTGKERDAFETAIQRRTKIIGKNTRIDLTELKVTLLALTIVDETGNLLFSQEDLEALNSKSAKVINDLFEVAQRMNGLGDDAVEELQGN